MPDLSLLSSYDYTLPEELIASKPLENREDSRLLVIDRKNSSITHHNFSDLPTFLEEGDQLVFNDSKVLKARLYGQKESGAKIELLLLKEKKPGVWEALIKPGKKMPLDATVHFDSESSATVTEVHDEGTRTIEFKLARPFYEFLQEQGALPLPHYMQRGAEKLDETRYQTVYAKKLGSVAAPTAGLHFSKPLLEKLAANGVDREFVTLHVGLGTFKPVQVENVAEHKMHSEPYVIPKETAEALNKCKKRRIAVGTTACRTLESALQGSDHFVPSSSDTELFITPGYSFRSIDCLITNFHLPKSTLLMLVSAFAGYDLTMRAYEEAVKRRYRFFSYGDAMLML